MTAVNTHSVACLQMNSSADLSENLDYIRQQLELANDANVKLLLLPENFAQLPKRSKDQHVEIMGDGPVQCFLSSKAKQYSMSIIAGALPVKVDGRSRPFARSLVFDGNGDTTAQYDKIHLYDVDLPDGQRYRESSSYTQGSNDINTNIVVAKTPVGNVGLSICYDLRFPEMYRHLLAGGAQIVTMPAAFTAKTGVAHWQALLQARAIENQVFVMAAAQTGTHDNGRKTWGDSMIIDPWGTVLASKRSEAGLVIANIDLDQQQRLRHEFPVLTHRRLL